MDPFQGAVRTCAVQEIQKSFRDMEAKKKHTHTHKRIDPKLSEDNR